MSSSAFKISSHNRMSFAFDFQILWFAKSLTIPPTPKQLRIHTSYFKFIV